MATVYGDCSDQRADSVAQGPKGLLLAVSSTVYQGSFVAFVDPNSQNPVQVEMVVDSASLQVGPYCPLEIISIVGKGLGPKQGASGMASNGSYATKLAGTQVMFGGLAAPLLFVSDTKINAIVPGAIYLPWGSLEVNTAAGTSAPYVTWLVQATPEIFSVDQSGVGQGAISNADGTANSASNPAARGSVISIFGTGGGLTNPVSGDGVIAQVQEPLAYTTLYVSIGGSAANVTYAGSAVGFVNGVMQIDAQVPADAPVGPATAIVVSEYGFRSRTGITVAIK
jgi:uncharacterized protein (TIGR03437 family)